MRLTPLVLLALSLPLAAQVTIHVDDDAAPGGDGTSWATAHRYLRDALASAMAGDVVVVAEGTYRPDEGAGAVPGDRSATFLVPGDVDLFGGFLGTESVAGQTAPEGLGSTRRTVLSGDLFGDDQPDGSGMGENSYHVVTADGESGQIYIRGFRIAGGNADGPALSQRSGGGLRVVGAFDPTGQQVVGVERTLFVGNRALESGGAIYSHGPIGVLVSEFAGNVAGDGGAVAVRLSGISVFFPAPSFFLNCLFRGNVASGSAGAVSVQFDPGVVPFLPWELNGCTVADNQAGGAVGGVTSNGGARVLNCVLWGNVDAAGSGLGAQLDPVLLGSSERCCIEGWTAGAGGLANLGANPMFAGASGPDGVAGTSDDNYRLLAGSPALDAGTQSPTLPGVLPTGGLDLDLYPRPYDDPSAPNTGVDPTGAAGGTLDLGCYERQGEDVVVCDDGGVPVDASDCDGDGLPDACDPGYVFTDCNRNGVHDACDIWAGTSQDVDGDGIPDDCDEDPCVDDPCLCEPCLCDPCACDVFGPDCDCDGDGIPNSAEPDCDGDGIPDDCEIDTDCNANGVPDSCELATLDCDGDGVIDTCTIFEDCDGDDVPDACQADDCNGNGVPDSCDVGTESSPDCNGNGLPDECDVAQGASDDCDGDGVPDECQVGAGSPSDCDGNGVVDACESFADCNGNGLSDVCDVLLGGSADANGNGVPDECEADCDGDGVADHFEADCDANGTPDDCQTFADCNGNGVPDPCDVAEGVDPDVDGDGIPDSCGVLYVDVDAPPGGDGTSWAKAFDDFSDALAALGGASRTLWVAEGVYPLPAGATEADSFVLTEGATWLGGFAGVETSVAQRDPALHPTILEGLLASGEHVWHVVRATNVAVGTIDGFTIRGGRADSSAIADGQGGGVRIEGGAPVLRDCVVEDCWASQGGGLLATESEALLERVTFRNNEAGGANDGQPHFVRRGGGGAYLHRGAVRVVDCRFEANLAGFGGGLCVSTFDDSRVEGSLFVDNQGLPYGGAAYARRSSRAAFVGCTFRSTDLSAIRAKDGAGLAAYWSAMPRVVHSRFEGLRAGYDGGAISAKAQAVVTAEGCVFVGCQAVDGHSLFVGAVPSALVAKECTIHSGVPGRSVRTQGGMVEFANSVLWRSTPGLMLAGPASSIRVDSSCVRGGWSGPGSGNITADPLFVDALGPDGVVGTADDDVRLSAGSPCLDLADPALRSADVLDLDGDGDVAEPVPFDLAGLPRAIDGDGDALAIADLGAYERFGEGDCDGDGVADGLEPDCDGNFVPDDCEVLVDCNANGVLDACELASGTSLDADGNGVPDECDPDCDADGVPDAAERDCDANGVPDDCEPGVDCNGNGLPDRCDVAVGVSPDADGNGVPDECDPDCDGDGLLDVFEADCDANGVPDDCEPSLDCDANGVPDRCDLAAGDATDADGNGVPDDCEADCDGDGVVDALEVDCDGNGVPDDCEPSLDCNGNGLPDRCDLSSGISADLNGNGIPDECDPDCDGNGLPDEFDLATDPSADEDGNGVIDYCEAILVDASAAPGGDGLSWATAFHDLELGLQAVDAVRRQVWVARGTYVPSNGSGRDVSFYLADGAQWLGGFAGSELRAASRRPAENPTILEGRTPVGRAFHVVQAHDAGPTSVIDGFTIQYGSSSGGGIRITGGAPVVRNCNVSRCSASSGGGAYASASDVRFEAVSFTKNVAASGGALFVNGGAVVLVGCLLEGNGGRTGGGAVFQNASVRVEGGEFRCNESSSDGGALWADRSTLTCVRCEFVGIPRDEVADDGGGIHATSTDLRVSGCRFRDLECDDFSCGAGISSKGGTMLVENCSFVRCRGGLFGATGGALRRSGPLVGRVDHCTFVIGGIRSVAVGVEVSNSIFGSRAGATGPTVLRHCWTESPWLGAGSGNLSGGPLFESGLHLSALSVCIDAGDPGLSAADDLDLDGDGDLLEPLPLDLDGFPRSIDGDGDGTSTPDMGAYERMEP